MDLNFISIDKNHIDLIYSLLICAKPIKTLEIGIGSGLVTQKIVEAYEYNKIKPQIDCVDNFFDWNQHMPEHISKLKSVNIINMSEEHFISSCNNTYDFIISDADHYNTHKWIDQTCGLLNKSGILIYHDITNSMFPNLLSILNYFQTNRTNYSHFLFNKSTLAGERCHRGLLVIQKH